PDVFHSFLDRRLLVVRFERDDQFYNHHAVLVYASELHVSCLHDNLPSVYSTTPISAPPAVTTRTPASRSAFMISSERRRASRARSVQRRTSNSPWAASSRSSFRPGRSPTPRLPLASSRYSATIFHFRL